MSHLEILIEYAKAGNLHAINWYTGSWYPTSDVQRQAYRTLALACLNKVPNVSDVG